MAQAEFSPSVGKSSPTSNDGVFSVSTNTAVHQVIDIAEARAMLAKANSSSQGLTAWALDLARKITGTEHSARVSEYADLVSLRARAVTLSTLPVSTSTELTKEERLGPDISANDESSYKKSA